MTNPLGPIDRRAARAIGRTRILLSPPTRVMDLDASARFNLDSLTIQL